MISPGGKSATVAGAATTKVSAERGAKGVLTNIQEKRGKETAEGIVSGGGTVVGFILMGRAAQPEEIGGLAIMPASKTSNHGRGRTFVMDGGCLVK